MIRKPTLLILGAGASKDIGYPTGIELNSWITGSEYNVSERSQLSLEFKVRSHFFNMVSTQTRESFELLGVEFKDSGLDSIDAFLTSRPEFQDIGKTAIAGLILAAEKEVHGSLFRLGSWYRYLFQLMKDQVGNFEDFCEKNKLSVITFNYDISLELFLLKAAMKNWRLSAKDAEILFKKIKIVHVHGKVAGFSWENDQVRKLIDIVDSRDYADKNLVSKAIEIYSEREMVDGAALVDAKTYTNIFISGFSFQRENIKKLFASSGFGYYVENADVYSSAFDLREGERLWIKSLLELRKVDDIQIIRRGELNFLDGTTLDLLRQYRQHLG
jgi:hypothetical protein